MECNDIKSVLSDYLSDNLDGDAVARVRKHLRECCDCARELSLMKQMISELGGLEKYEAPPDFLARVHRKSATETPLKRFFKALFKPVALKIPLQLTAMAILGVIVFFTVPYQRFQEGPSETIGQAPSPRVAFEEERPRKSDFAEKKSVSKPERPLAAAPSLSHVAEPEPEASTAAPASSAVRFNVRLALASAASQDERANGRISMYEAVAKPATGSSRTLAKDKGRFAEGSASEKTPFAQAPSADTAMENESRRFNGKEKMPAEIDSESLVGKSEIDTGFDNEKPVKKADRQRTERGIRETMESFEAVLLSESTRPSGQQLLEIRIPSERFEAFFSRLETLGDVKTPKPTLPEPPPATIIVDLLLIPE